MGRVRGSYSPPSHSVEEIKGKGIAVLRLYENVTEVNEVDEEGGGAFVGWEFDRYTLTVPWDSGIAPRVAADVPAWLQHAKDTECAELAAENRKVRNEYLKATDHVLYEDSENSEEQKTEIKDLRRRWKHLPECITWPYCEVPPIPEWVKIPQ